MSAFWRIAPFIFAGLILGVAPITGPDLPARVMHYIKPEPPPEATLIAVGDIMLSRMVATKMRQKGLEYPFASTTNFLQNADIAFGNLETSITPGPEVLPFEMSFRANPESTVALRDAGFDVLSLANNHTMNFGEVGMRDTLRHLDEVGIVHAGGGTETEANQPMFVTTNGIRFAFLAYTDSRIVPTEYEAVDERLGIAFMRTERMQETVRGAKNFADIVIVSMHAGDEYEPLPHEHQIAFAHAAIDAGAEMVIGHHSHVVQNMEIYNGKHIFYSLGNFVFDQMWSRATREGLALKAVFTKAGLKDVTFHPVIIEDYAQPRLIEPGMDFDAVIGRLSTPLGGVDREE